MSNPVAYEEELARSGTILFTVKGVSMRPLFRTATDAILVVKCALEDLKNLDIVLFMRPGPNGVEYVLHRIVDRMPDGKYIIAGDNCIGVDIVDPSDILGVVKSAKRGNKEIPLTGFKYSLYKNLWCRPYKFRSFCLRTKARIKGIGRRIIKGRK